MTSSPIHEETRGNRRLSIQMIKSKDGIELALARLPSEGPPLLLIHGSFSNRGFWISPKGVGLAAFLVDRGFDVYILEKRGRGLSPKGPSYRQHSGLDTMRFDLPAAVEAVGDSRGQAVRLLGHSSGGLLTLGSLGGGWLEPSRLSSLAVLGCQLSLRLLYHRRPWRWLIAGLVRLLGRFPSPQLGMGPEPEPAAEVLEFLRWRGQSRLDDGQGRDLLCFDRMLDLPFHLLAGAGDKEHPPDACQKLHERLLFAQKTFTVLGRNQGFRRDYGHVDMLISPDAQAEVWPLLARWIDDMDGHADMAKPGPGV